MKTWNSALAFMALSICLSSGARADEVVVQIYSDAQIQAQLEAKLQAAPAPATPATLQSTVDALATLADAPKVACDESQKIKFGGGAYVMTASLAGEPCRVYDLSFPTIQSFMGPKKIAQIPLNTYTLQDYYDWLTGNTAAVIARHQGDLNGVIPQDNWSAKISLNQASPMAMGFAGPAVSAEGLPDSFYASDLNVGSFQLSAADRARVLQVGAQVRAMSGSTAKSADMDFWRALANNPKSFLSKIRFQKNAQNKVYDVFMEGTFLPIRGPVVLVDFNEPYRPAIDGMIRSTAGGVLSTLSLMIPDPRIQNMVYFAVNQAFGMLDGMYSYQSAALEQALRTESGSKAPAITPAQSTRALNLLFGAQTNFLAQMITAKIQKKEVDWLAVEKSGRVARYDVEKARFVRKSTTNSQLVLANKCTMSFIGDSFGICSKNGVAKTLYDLAGTNTILNTDFGAPMIYVYNQPYQIAALRGMAWLVSAAVMIAPIPIQGRSLRQLSGALSSYATAGVSDEARMKQALVAKKRSGVALSAVDASMLKSLYIQNINPLLPKTEELENNVIRANAALLK